MSTLTDELCDFLISNGIAAETEIQLVSDINGYSEKTMLDILYASTGLRSIEQALDEGYAVSEYLQTYYDIK